LYWSWTGSSLLEPFKTEPEGEKQEKEGDLSRIIVNKVKEKAVKRDGSFACFVIDIKITTTSYSSV
jgi:hypothetical protein